MLKVNMAVVEAEKGPLVAVMVSTYVPAVIERHETVVVPVVVKLASTMFWHDRFVTVLLVRRIVPVKPLMYVTVIVEVSAVPMFWAVDELADIEKPGVTVNVAIVERTTD